jgi:hypothetical protein
MTGLSVAAVMAAADAGPVLAAEIFPLSGAGKVRVTYNWLYSALNVDPNDSSPFVWVFRKMPDGSVALSPRTQVDGLTVFVSLYPDDSLRFVAQVQWPEPDSGYPEWNTSPEEMTLTGLDLLTVELMGANGSYLGVDGSITRHGNHAGYLILSNAGTPGPSSKFFVAVQQNLQAKAQAPLFASRSEADLRSELERHGAGDSGALATVIRAAAAR